MCDSSKLSQLLLLSHRSYLEPRLMWILPTWKMIRSLQDAAHDGRSWSQNLMIDNDVSSLCTYMYVHSHEADQLINHRASYYEAHYLYGIRLSRSRCPLRSSTILTAVPPAARTYHVRAPGHPLCPSFQGSYRTQGRERSLRQTHGKPMMLFISKTVIR